MAFVFFLGGYDAEMAEIRTLLKETKQKFVDKKLGWGACISNYLSEIRNLSADVVPVLIELLPDAPPPDNAVIIDHHGDRAGKDEKTSLEQVAELLNVILDRRRRLICANDRGHIRGMLAENATSEEIADIRAFDRKMQGVTEEDEALAEESVRTRLKKIGCGGAYIESLTSRTAPVLDRVWDRFRHVFIATPDGEISYSGEGAMVKRLCRRYEEMKARDPTVAFWYGGELPEFGFFGSKTPLTHEEAEKMIQESETVYSQHIFMFPFTIKEPSESVSSRGDFLESVCAALKGGRWKPQEFDPALSPGDYSEFFYFHHFVRDAIYDIKKRKKENDAQKTDAPNTDENTPLLKYFTRDSGENPSFGIYIRDENKVDRYRLAVRSVSLRIYDTRIGILALELANKEHPDMADVLKINDFGRRIYPQFMGPNGTDDTKGAFLADRIIFSMGDGDPVIEDFAEDRFRKDRLVTARYIEHLLGDAFTSDAEEFENGQKSFLYKPTVDDRMYVVCWYGSHSLSGQLKSTTTDGGYAYADSDKWYQFVYMDGKGPTCAHREMKRKLIETATYERWAEYGTLYGVSRYGLVCITPHDDFGCCIIRDHMRRQYAQMAAILLAQRASLLRFSEDVSEISGLIKRLDSGDEIKMRTVAGKVEKLHASYIRFVNRLWFTEVTHQEQGIEMYDKAVKIMRLKEDMQDLKAEIKELYEFVSISHERFQMEREREVNRKMNTLTALGTMLLPVVLLTGFFGMNLDFVEEGFKGLLETSYKVADNEVPTWLPFLTIGLSLLAFFGVALKLSFRVFKNYLSHIVEDENDIAKQLELRRFITRKSPSENKKP